MTRETKIGLLVGLAFIIVIGVLLSDHIQSSTEPRRAQLSTSSETLRRGIEVPGGQSNPIEQVVMRPVVEPTSQVATQDQLSGAMRPGQVIRIGPPSNPARFVPTTPEATTAGDRNGPIVVSHETSPSGPQIPLMADGPSTQSQSNHGVVIVTPAPPTPEQQIDAVVNNTAGRGERTEPARPTGVRSHVAVEGDSVYKLTVKYYGGYSKSRETLIVKANPAMGGRAEKITIGQTYAIPALPGKQPVVESAVADRAQQAGGVLPPIQDVSPTLAPTPQNQTPAQAARGTTYKVRDGDSLWKIADRTGTPMSELKSLNRDVLKGGDIVRPGMTLKLPAKAASASAN